MEKDKERLKQELNNLNLTQQIEGASLSSEFIFDLLLEYYDSQDFYIRQADSGRIDMHLRSIGNAKEAIIEKVLIEAGQEEVLKTVKDILKYKYHYHLNPEKEAPTSLEDLENMYKN